LVERDSSSPVWWLVVGGALGAGLALLFAPEPGSKTRRILARRLARLRSSAEDLLGEFRDASASDEEEDEEEEAEAETGAEAETALDDDDDDDETDEDEDADDVEDEDAVKGARVHALSAREELEKRLVAARARRQRERTDEDEEPVA
jgi:gas vesicle protein